MEISLTRAGAIQSSSEYGALEAAIAKAEGFYNPTFAEAKTRDNINSGESIPTLFGKVKKWFTDLNTLIKLVGSTDISGIGNGTVTDALSVLNSNKVSNDGKWINLDNTSIFEYFKPDGKIIIACIYNASEYPSSFTSEDKWCMVLKANERIVLLTVAGVFIAKASNGVWSKKWTRL